MISSNALGFCGFKNIEKQPLISVVCKLRFPLMCYKSLKLDRTQLQHWLLFLEHKRSENSNVVAGLPVPQGHDCVYDSPFDFE